MLQQKAAPSHPPFLNYLPPMLHKPNLPMYGHESLPYTLSCWEAQGSGLTQGFRSTRNGGQERNSHKQCCRSLGHFPPSSMCFHGWWHHGKCHTMTCANTGSQHCQQLHLRESSLVFWISTDRAGQSSEDGQVRKTSAGEY